MSEPAIKRSRNAAIERSTPQRRREAWAAPEGLSTCSRYGAAMSDDKKTTTTTHTSDDGTTTEKTTTTETHEETTSTSSTDE